MSIVYKSTLEKGLKRYLNTTQKISEKAKIKMGLQLINWIANGSPNVDVTPPILTGRLRGSGSAFVDSKVIGTTDNGNGTPNMSHTTRKNEIAIGFNTPYAARWHENPFVPGPISEQSGNVGNKYISIHLEKDGKDLMKMYSLLMKKGLG